MQVEIYPTAAAAAIRTASLMAESLRRAVTARGHGTVALSGGRTPEAMYDSLVAMPVPWPRIDVFQVDERVVDEADERSNMRALRAAFGRADLPPQQLHRMPVDAAPLERGAAQYARELDAAAGTPPTLDVVHLGLGADGHTASLVPGDDALDAEGDVALTHPYMGVRRMTLTLGVLNRARLRVWLVTGRAKQEAVSRLMHAEPAMIATRVRRDESILVLDEDAAAEPQ